MTEAEMVEHVRAMQPDSRYRPADYLQGYCTLSFSSLARWKGFEDAVREVEFLIGRDVCPGCNLPKTYAAFREMEKRVKEKEVAA